MIDTVVLSIPAHKFKILDHAKFKPNSRGLFVPPYTDFAGMPFTKCVQNPTRADEQSKNYKPRLTLIKRVSRGGNFNIALKIEFSVPKLLYGNNFEEVSRSDFNEILDTLFGKLCDMSVMVKKSDLRNAKVATIHYGKNIAFTDFTTSSSILRKVQKANYTERLDLNRTNFRNEGEAVYFYAKSHSLVLYDKVKDLNKPKSRSVEQEKAFNLQMDIFEEIRKKNRKPLEILRIEARICEKRKLESLLEKIGKKGLEHTFDNLFSAEISREILLDYWETLWKQLRATLIIDIPSMELFEYVLKDPKVTPMKALAMFGFAEMLKSEGARKMKAIFKKRFSGRSFSRQFDEVENFDLSASVVFEPFRKIERDLRGMRPVRMEEFKDFLISDVVKNGV